jgi:hypothetical protein
MAEDLWFDRLVAASGPPAPDRAPARLKSTIYYALVARIAEAGPLHDLRRTTEAGGQLCVFERAVAFLPAGPTLHSTNPCRICHARVLGERMTHAPIFWAGCPYSEFHNG